MHETIDLLETALEKEAGLFLKLINELENDDLFEFIRLVAVVEPCAGRSAAQDILRIAQNVRGIEVALENFYSHGTRTWKEE